VRRHWRIGLVLATLAAFACNALTGASDLGIADECDACDAGPPPGSDDAGLDASDAMVVADAADAAVPSYCAGIVFYARLDGTFTSAEGIAPDAPPDASFGIGKFDAAATILGDAGAIFYPVGAKDPYPQAEGSIAMWFKPTWSSTQTAVHLYFKPATDKLYAATNTVGPQIVDFGATRGLGLTSNNVDASFTEALLPPATWKAGWHELGWNHFVASWRRTPSLLAFTLNGGATDAGADGGVTHVETTSPWYPQAAAAGFLRFGSAGNPIEGSLDDVAIWSRVLPPDEVQAIYASTQSIGKACRR